MSGFTGDEEYECSLELYVNGTRKVILSPDPNMTLLQYVRSLGLTGTKLGCGEGGCGACTVIISKLAKGVERHLSVNACLMPLCSLDGTSVTTIEGLGSCSTALHPVQERIATCHGSQCGFCTPGIVMSACAQLKTDPNSTPHDLEDCLDGNLCRCTGYRPILDAVKSLSKCKEGGVNGHAHTSDTAEQHNHNCCGETLVHNISEEAVMSKDAVEGIDKLQPTFPKELVDYRTRQLHFKYGNVSWYQPSSLESLLRLKNSFPSARLVVGNTEIGIETHFKGMEYNTIINPTKVLELSEILLETNGIRIGGSVSINEFRDYIKDITDNKTLEEYKIRSFTAIYHMLSWFASNQIRNAACIAGNIVTASPISDLNPMLLACDARLLVKSMSGGERQVPISEFFKSYRKVDLAPTEVLIAVWIPYTMQLEFTIPFKQARRREDDISIVTAGVRLKLEITDEKYFIKDARCAFGGLAPTTILGSKTAAALVDKPFEPSTFEAACAAAKEEFTLPSNVPGGQAEYRTALAASFIFKTFYIINSEINLFIENCNHLSDVNSFPSTVPVKKRIQESASNNWVSKPKPPTRGEQSYHMRKGGIQTANPPHGENTTQERVSVGAPLMHKSAMLQVTGEAVYTDDQPLPPRAVHAALVTSSKAHAHVKSVDISEARGCDGFISYFDHKDVQGSNSIGAVVKDEEVFVTKTATHVGAVIGIIVAETHSQALSAAKKVKIEYEDLPAIISIEDAIKAGSFFECFPPTANKQMYHEISNADESEFNSADVVVTGSSKIGGQEHFYLETNATVITPIENGSLEILSSTQNPTKTQKFCAAVVGLQASKVVAKCKRMGGGFGGKETRSVFIACAAAVAAQKMNRPVSINIERDLDMQITGQRHAFHVEYRAGCSSEGKLKFLDAKIYNNAGFSLDLSQAVMDRALFHCDNVYYWPALRIQGKVCRTNQASHTAFRGFGGPQGLMVSEIVLEHLAHITGIDKVTLRHQNFYKIGDKTHFGQTITDFYVDKLWKEILDKADLNNRRASVSSFNKNNKWKKRGMAIIPTKFGINFTAKFMNQGGALVHVYTDGTVLVSHGGTEMGQGLHTKMIQVAAQSFGIPDSNVHVADTSTNTVANSSPTAASMSTDLYGMAVLDACEQILARLMPLRKKMSSAGNSSVAWVQLIEAAFFERIDLSAHGYYAVDSDRCGYDWNHATCGTDNVQRGMPFNYFTQGVCAVEVEVDCLTGDSVIMRADINMDVGKSINPVLDIGQIEGAFTQGFGWSTMEELVWGDSDHPWIRPGNLFTKGPGTYKIPAFNDVPKDFRIYLSDTENKFCVHSSKAIGEPPFFLGSTVYWAINDAIAAFRKEEVDDIEVRDQFFITDLPATTERIRMACCDNIVSMCTGANAGYRPKGSW